MKHFRITSGVLLAALVATSACSTGPYRFRPEVKNEADVGEQAGATYQIPNKRVDEGTVRVTSTGVVKLQNEEREDDQMKTMHLRMVITNESKDDWNVNTDQQMLSLPKHVAISPIRVNANQDTIPDVTVKPGEQQIVDLYYDLPKSMEEADEIPRFKFTWQVRTASKSVKETTTFDRVDLTPDVATVPYGYGWGPGYATGYGMGYGPGLGLGWGNYWWGV